MHRTEPKPVSLRGRLLALLLLASVGAWIVGGWLIYVESRQLGERLSDEALKETGTLLLQLAQHEIAEHGLSLGALLLRNEVRPAGNEFHYQIWTEDSRSAYRSAGSPERPFLPLNAVGYGSTEVGGQPWRTYAVWNQSHSLQIQIAQSVDYSRGMARNIALRLMATLSVLLIVTAALIGWIVSRTMRPLLTTAEAVAARSPEDLSSVGEGGAPTEVLPLVQAINRLLKRVREALQQERRFTADAAHELRTPLAAVRANAQVICNARSPAEMTEAASDLMISVDRGSRVIDQLLALARADAQSSGAADMVELADLVESQCELQGPEASAGEVRLQAEAQPCEVMGHVDLLSVMLRNLIDNAIRYSPSGVTVRVACHRTDGGAELTVTDDGPGIPVDERERVFDRFRRLQTARRPGSGLGLSIVRRIAELHGATVSIGDGVGGAAGRGTTVTVRFSAEKNQGE
jgi:signal transduction histidine kinase